MYVLINIHNIHVCYTVFGTSSISNGHNAMFWLDPLKLDKTNMLPTVAIGCLYCIGVVYYVWNGFVSVIEVT